jgi:vacuolar-type H+-ATPase subunit H
MSKQFISEAQRMQKLANMPISEMAIPEMARAELDNKALSVSSKIADKVLELISNNSEDILSNASMDEVFKFHKKVLDSIMSRAYEKYGDSDIEESKKALSEDKENIVNFLNANIKEFISKLGNPGSKFENLGDPKVATAGKSDTSGIDVSFDREHMLKLFPKNDPYNVVEEIEIAGKKVYYNDYR